MLGRTNTELHKTYLQANNLRKNWIESLGKRRAFRSEMGFQFGQNGAVEHHSRVNFLELVIIKVTSEVIKLLIIMHLE